MNEEDCMPLLSSTCQRSFRQPYNSYKNISWRTSSEGHGTLFYQDLRTLHESINHNHHKTQSFHPNSRGKFCNKWDKTLFCRIFFCIDCTIQIYSRTRCHSKLISPHFFQRYSSRSFGKCCSHCNTSSLLESIKNRGKTAQMNKQAGGSIVFTAGIGGLLHCIWKPRSHKSQIKSLSSSPE